MNVADVINRGDVDALRRLLAEEPELARSEVVWGPSEHPNASDLLHYVSDAPFHSLGRHDRWGELARALIEAGAPVDGPSEAGETPLITAASLGQLDVARALIHAGADLERRGEAVPDGTALAHAVRFGMPECADALVEGGAHIDSIADAAGTGDVNGWLTPETSREELMAALRAAAVCGRTGVIGQVLAAGLPVQVNIDGATVLHWAAWEGKANSVRHLLEAGADPRAREDHFQLTPLGWALHRHSELGDGWGHAEVERILRPVTPD